MKFHFLMSRADDETLQTIIGKSTVRILMSLDSGLATPSKLRELVIKLKQPDGLLLTPTTRNALFGLLRPEEAKDLCELLGLNSSKNLYSQLESINVQRGSNRESLLFAFFELEPPDIESKIAVPSIESWDPNYSLFAHQRDVVRKVKIDLYEPPYRVLLHMPTGSGKTRTTMNIVADHLRKYEPSVAVWLAYSEELCEQAAGEFIKSWSSLGNRKINIYRFWGNHSLNFDEIKDGLVIAGLPKSYSSLTKNSDSLINLGGKCSLIIIDEAHQAIAKSYRLVLDILFTLGRKSSLLGLSATPGRTWADINADAELASFFNNRKITLQVQGYNNPIDYLVSERYIAKTIFTSLTYNGGTEITEKDLDRMSKSLDIPGDILERLGEINQRNLLIILSAEKLARSHKRIIVFASSVKHSDVLACALQARGFHAYSLTSSIPSSRRLSLISDFKNNEECTKILCNFGILTTGFDAPKTSAAIIARPTKSLVLYSQMVGRAIRGERAGGNKSAEIVTVIDQALPGFGSITDAFNNWEDVWNDK